MSTLICAFDLETTGVKYYKHAIHQLSGQILIDDKVVEHFDFKICPHEKALIEDEALKASGVTREQVTAYPNRTIQFNAFLALLNKYVDPFKADQKFWMLGYNISWFDCEFLRNFFTLENNDLFSNYFWQQPLDIYIMAAYYLMPERHLMPSFKLKRTCIWCGIQVDESRLHDAQYDIELTLQLYYKVRGKTINDDW